MLCPVTYSLLSAQLSLLIRNRWIDMFTADRSSFFDIRMPGYLHDVNHTVWSNVGLSPTTTYRRIALNCQVHLGYEALDSSASFTIEFEGSAMKGTTREGT